MVLTREELLAKHPGAFDSIKKKVKAEERRAAWLKNRAGRITASNVYKLFTSKYETANNKTSRSYINERVAQAIGSRLPQFSTPATRWGNDNEVEAVEEYMKATGAIVTKYGENQEFVKLGKRQGATPDGLVDPDELIQVKCPYNPANHVAFLMTQTQEEFKADYPQYYLQMQMELLVTRRKRCNFVSYDPRIPSDFKLHILKIERDEAVLRVMIAHLINIEEEIEDKIKLINLGF